MFKQILLLAIMLLSSMYLFAQNKCDETAIRKSLLQARNNKYAECIATLEASVKKYPNCAETYKQLAEFYYRTNQIDQSIQSVCNCIKIDEIIGISSSVYINQLMQSYSEDAFSTKLLNAILTIPSLSKENKIAIQQLNLQQFTKRDLMAKKVTDLPINMGEVINNQYQQNFPTLTLDEKTMVFISSENPLNEDFYLSKYDTCNGWSKAIPLAYPPNTSAPEQSARLSVDGNYLFFTRCDVHSENGWDGGGCDIIFSYKINDSTWSSPQKFGATINSPGYEGQASLSSDNKTMYFVSDRLGGYGGLDIWKSEFKMGLWQLPINLGKSINTSGNEKSPFMHPDNETFYFISNGRKGVGGDDAFVSKCKGDTQFTMPINLGYPINTVNNEASITISANGKFGMISSSKSIEVKALDIFQFNTYKEIQPKATVCIKGFIYDKLDETTLKKYRIHIYDSVNNLIQTISSNSGDGSFAFPLIANQLYTCRVDESDEYKAFSTTIDTKKLRSQGIIYIDIPLKLPETIDSLYNFHLEKSIVEDTALALIRNEYNRWNKYSDDSIVVFCTIYNNNFVDSSFASNVCFSDSGYVDYLKYIDRSITSRTFLQEKNATFYKKYLKDSAIPLNKIQFIIKENTWTDDRLFSIDLNVVEYY